MLRKKTAATILEWLPAAPTSLSMRLHLTLALITALALVITLHAGRDRPFAFAQVEEMAKKRAMTKFVAIPDVLPPQLKKLTPQQDAGIFWKDTYRLWRKKGLPFQVDFYPQLNSNPLPHVAPEINTVDRKGAHRLAYSPTFFNFLNVTTNPPTPLVFNPPPPSRSWLRGFYLRYPIWASAATRTRLTVFFSALGGSYFRVLCEGAGLRPFRARPWPSIRAIDGQGGGVSRVHRLVAARTRPE